MSSAIHSDSASLTKFLTVTTRKLAQGDNQTDERQIFVSNGYLQSLNALTDRAFVLTPNPMVKTSSKEMLASRVVIKVMDAAAHENGIFI